MSSTKEKWGTVPFKSSSKSKIYLSPSKIMPHTHTNREREREREREKERERERESYMFVLQFSVSQFSKKT